MLVCIVADFPAFTLSRYLSGVPTSATFDNFSRVASVPLLLLNRVGGTTRPALVLTGSQIDGVLFAAVKTWPIAAGVLKTGLYPRPSVFGGGRG